MERPLIPGNLLTLEVDRHQPLLLDNLFKTTEKSGAMCVQVCKTSISINPFHCLLSNLSTSTLIAVLRPSGKKITAFVPNDGCLNFVDENDEVLIAGFGRSGHA
jgi:hypothetical protein